jgi:hypothetical protein
MATLPRSFGSQYSGSLGFIWFYWPRSVDKLYLAEANVTWMYQYMGSAHLYAFALYSSYARSQDHENNKLRQACTYESWGKHGLHSKDIDSPHHSIHDLCARCQATL